jgi:hypothetical protein
MLVFDLQFRYRCGADVSTAFGSRCGTRGAAVIARRTGRSAYRRRRSLAMAYAHRCVARY